MVKEIVVFGDYPEPEALRIAACLEEHFPHSMAKAVVDAARKRKLYHEEMHSKVEYIVAHGISSYIDGKKAVICIEDPLRDEAKDMVEMLRAEGISKIVMMTGDSERTAASIAGRVGVDEYYAEVLPEDKAAYIEKEKAAGRKVVMIGDGINDSPALSAADTGIAISDGAELAISLRSMSSLLPKSDYDCKKADI